MDDVVRDFGTVATRISMYGLGEGRVARLQESAYLGHYDFLHKIHSLAVNRMETVDRLYRFDQPQEVLQPAGCGPGGGAGVVGDPVQPVQQEGESEVAGAEEAQDAAGGSAGAEEEQEGMEEEGEGEETEVEQDAETEAEEDAAVAEVMSTEEYVVKNMPGGGLRYCGVFRPSNWISTKVFEKPREDSWTDCPIVKFRPTTLDDLSNPELKTASYPRCPGPCIYHEFKKPYAALKVVGVCSKGHVYRVPDNEVVATQKFPPGFSGAMYVEAVKIFFEKRAAAASTKTAPGVRSKEAKATKAAKKAAAKAAQKAAANAAQKAAAKSAEASRARTARAEARTEASKAPPPTHGLDNKMVDVGGNEDRADADQGGESTDDDIPYQRGKGKGKRVFEDSDDGEDGDHVSPCQRGKGKGENSVKYLDE
ncbi:unnamed protein product [Ectocarpus sp. CCAP 1310/34]|nr:unnamed protein product [Ectocarpus sp. CCAP 1310/34]